MNSKISNPYYHIIYWIFVTFVLVLIFGKAWENVIAAFYYIALLLPVIMGTSYFFNYFLVPRFLLNKKYLQFGLFFFYTLVISLYLEMIVLIVAFIYLVNFDTAMMNPNATDTVLLAVFMYMVVFLSSFLIMIKQLSEAGRKVRSLMDDKEKMENGFLELISNRRSVRIPYAKILFIESLADYIKVNTPEKEIMSKEKISSVEKRLPDLFLRIHRSFIINIQHIAHFNSSEIEVNGNLLNIGRNYRKDVQKRLKSDQTF